MKKQAIGLMFALTACAGLVSGCGSSSGTATTTAAETTAAETEVAAEETEAAETQAEAEETEAEASGEKPFAGQTLSISTFAFNAELLQKNIYDPFMEETGCELIVEGAANAARVTKIKESPQDYDIVIIGDSFIVDLINDGLIAEIDRSALTNLDALYDCAKAPFGEEYGPAYTFNRIGIVYDSAFCPIELTSWTDLWSPELEDSIAIPDITATTGPLFYYMTAKAFDLTPGEDDDAIFAKLEELKPNIVKTYTSANDTITMLNQGEVNTAVLLDYSYTTAKQASEDYVWVDPSEGSYSGFNAINILKDCENMDLAHAFVDYYISYEVQLAEALDGVDSPVRTDIELTEEQSQNFTYGEDTINNLMFPDWDVINANKADWITRWNELFSVQ
ncbi:MAG: extracellular solute-binding protein [Clostridiales bacterium]|nr:extracellular solute-binding protein [Clostridiales bacterium]